MTEIIGCRIHVSGMQLSVLVSMHPSLVLLLLATGVWVRKTLEATLWVSLVQMPSHGMGF